MIRARLDVVRQRDDAVSTNDNLADTMRNMRKLANIHNNRKIFVQSSAENDVNDDYFLD
jgi:hypothetical protein